MKRYLLVYLSAAFEPTAIESLLKHYIGIIEACKVRSYRDPVNMNVHCTNTHTYTHYIWPIEKLNECMNEKSSKRHITSRMFRKLTPRSVLYIVVTSIV